jgi:hypothetical protein
LQAWKVRHNVEPQLTYFTEELIPHLHSNMVLFNDYKDMLDKQHHTQQGDARAAALPQQHAVSK